MTDDLQVVERVLAVAQQHRHRLADVEHAASADGHDQIRTVLLAVSVAARATSMVGSPETVTTAAGSPSRSISA